MGFNIDRQSAQKIMDNVQQLGPENLRKLTNEEQKIVGTAGELLRKGNTNKSVTVSANEGQVNVLKNNKWIESVRNRPSPISTTNFTAVQKTLLQNLIANDGRYNQMSPEQAYNYLMDENRVTDARSGEEFKVLIAFMPNEAVSSSAQSSSKPAPGASPPHSKKKVQFRSPDTKLTDRESKYAEPPRVSSKVREARSDAELDKLAKSEKPAASDIAEAFNDKLGSEVMKLRASPIFKMGNISIWEFQGQSGVYGDTLKTMLDEAKEQVKSHKMTPEQGLAFVQEGLVARTQEKMQKQREEALKTQQAQLDDVEEQFKKNNIKPETAQMQRSKINEKESPELLQVATMILDPIAQRLNNDERVKQSIINFLKQ